MRHGSWLTAQEWVRTHSSSVKTKCPDIHNVPELTHLVPALERARKVPCDENDLVIGLCNSRGKVVGAATVRCYRQLSAFSREVAKLGYRPEVMADERRMDGCDVVFVMRLDGGLPATPVRSRSATPRKPS